MNKWRIFRMIIATFLLSGVASWSTLMAQEDEYNLAHNDVFGTLRRPQVVFSHINHSENLGDKSCGVCHHAPDNKTGKPVYVEGEELSCKECHGIKKDNNIVALREAFHGNCTVCHRNMIKTNMKTGPTTCGGCHKKI